MPSLSRLPDRLVRVGVVLLFLTVANCGNMEFGLNSETLDVVKCFASGECEIALGDVPYDEAAAQEDSADGLADVPRDSGSVSGETPDTGAPHSELLGTFKLHENFDSCAYDGGNAYDVPAILRLYLENQSIRFVDLNGQIVWSGPVYPDDTFDFTFSNADTQDAPDNVVSCACVLNNGLSEAQKDKTTCMCEPSSAVDESCQLDYIGL